MIKRITASELTNLVPLFNQYMVFYDKPPDSARYRSYLHDRLEREEAIVYVAYDESEMAIGFVLNYFSFSSLALGKIVVLNDIFVLPDARSQGVGKLLIEQSFELARENGAVRVDLGTAKDNHAAQKLYEQLGFVRDTKFYSYSYAV
jgi:ribosomal protein S18 acetylase RimI-like enzyme